MTPDQVPPHLLIADQAKEAHRAFAQYKQAVRIQKEKDWQHLLISEAGEAGSMVVVGVVANVSLCIKDRITM